MGKKGWFSAIKRVFGANPKEKLDKGTEKKSSKEKKKGPGILKHERTKSFIPLFREPSSIEKILGEIDQQQLQYRPSTPYDQPVTPTSFSTQPASPRNASQRITSPRNASRRATSPRNASRRVTSPRVASPRVTSPRATSPRASSPRAASPRVYRPRPEPTLRNHHLSATKIQAAYRGYAARRSFRALRGLVRLQGVVRGQNVKRQTMNAMKNLQLLVRVQTQIHSRRIQMLENQAIQNETYKNDGEAESTLGKWTLNSQAGDHEDWDDSLVTKEEVEARMQKKVEAAIKRERAMAYAYSNQLWKGHPKPGQTPLADMRSGAFPWWWTWLDRQPPSTKPYETQTMKHFLQTPSKQTPDNKPSPRPQSVLNYRQHNSGYENLETPTPRSSRSTAPIKTRQMFPPSRTPPPSMRKYLRARNSAADSTTGGSMKDDDSLMSCPPFSVPHYMSPTVSAIEKARPNSILKYQYPGTPTGSEAASKRRCSFPLAPNIGSFKWNEGSSKDLTPQKTVERHQPAHSIGDRSVDSAVSMPAAFGRKPFNRFV